MKEIGVAILGLGTVGGGTYEILTKNHEKIKQQANVDIKILAVMDLNEARLDELGVPKEIRYKNIAQIAMSSSINIVIETIGGTGIAKKFVLDCLRGGKTVVTANKELIAKDFVELHSTAKHANAGLYYEASCAGGTPVIRVLNDSMQANNIESIIGIVNGTTNYILSKMSDEGRSFQDVLKEAQDLGYAELNASADVDAFDATYKLSILSQLAFHGEIGIDKIFRQGISEIKSEDIQYGKELGYVIKLLAIGKNIDGKIEARVHPTFIPKSNPLASIAGSFNAINIVGDNVGDIMLYGRGAGALPTGSAIVSDVVYASKFVINNEHFYPTRTKAWKHTNFDYSDDFECSYYARLVVEDRAGALAKVGEIMKNVDVSIYEVIQKGQYSDGSVPLIITTHKTCESKMQKAIELANECEEIREVASIIRIEKRI